MGASISSGPALRIVDRGFGRETPLSAHRFFSLSFSLSLHLFLSLSLSLSLSFSADKITDGGIDWLRL